ncbi:oxidoreductase-like domain-containing protein [Lysobacter sp. A3-1-A15]|uniref:oxidoreductase-like domain-containing protein n=1 Tax=Novilysobacter viscosus TaxID=3098602 RepID=UPI002ED9C6CF
MTRPPDTPPVPPEKPLPTDCCGSGCAVCVNDAYQEELDAHEAQLEAWRARNAGGEGPGDGGAAGPEKNRRA